jgi:glutamate dehydrogenase
MAEIWERIETAKMPEAARIRLFDRAAAALADHMADLLRAGRGRLEPAATVGELGPAIRELSASTEKLLDGEARAESGRIRQAFQDLGAPTAEALLVTRLHDLDGAIGLASLARERNAKVAPLTRAFSLLGANLGLDWAQQTAARMSPTDPWERLLVNGLARDFQQMRLEFLRRLGGKADPLRAVEAWVRDEAQAVAQFRAIVKRAQGAVPAAPAMLAQLASQARNLLTR